ncbi:MAG TPA: hypothetical protein VNT26_24255, partial [Candidatus Sulfotelmatobacter sp.]|nr:hypothetical protein [Candidatus Sulfotelmatobacter sp.]
MSSEMGAAGSDPGFLDDFYTECDEHLMAIRRALGRLEEASGQGEVDPNLWQSLFRPFHSLKGIL